MSGLPLSHQVSRRVDSVIGMDGSIDEETTKAGSVQSILHGIKNE